MGNYEQETGMQGARGENNNDDEMAQMTFIIIWAPGKFFFLCSYLVFIQLTLLSLFTGFNYNDATTQPTHPHQPTEEDLPTNNDKPLLQAMGT